MKNQVKPFKVLAVALVLAYVVCAGSFGANAEVPYGTKGGYSGPGPAIVTVEEAKKMRDDSVIALEGYIVRHLGGDDYLFEDASGAINVEIDDKHWQGQQIGPKDKVQLYGELDKDLTRIEVDVKRVIKQ